MKFGRVTEQLGPDNIMVLALTGAVAIIVEDKTIHPALCFKSFPDLGSRAAINQQLSMDPVSFFIVDEFAMIGCLVLAALEQRCRKDKQDSIEPFSDLFV